MAKFAANELKIAINTTAETYVDIGYLTSIEHNPSTDKADMTTFSSAGRKEHLVVLRGDSFTIQGKTNFSDAGQAAVNTLGNATGSTSLKKFRVTVPGGVGSPTYTFDASAEVKLFGGGTTDGSNWSATIEVSGAITPGTVSI